MNLGAEYLENAIDTSRSAKALVERALVQVSDDQFFASLDSESNSIAVILKHVAGNLRSRWTDFLTTDGEKPDRGRDSEFEMNYSATRAELMQAWESGWQRMSDTLSTLAPEDLTKVIHIRGEPHAVVKAISRQLTHSSYHVGQIVLLAKHYAGDSWQALTVLRGKSQEYNAAMLSKSRA